MISLSKYSVWRIAILPALSFSLAHAGQPVSDDFSGPTLGSQWVQLGAGRVSLTGTHAQLSVDGGADHDTWPPSIDSLRLMQTISNTDFEVEVKLDSTVSEALEDQGILVEQDNNNYLRFDVYFGGSTPDIFCAAIIGGVPAEQVDSPISTGGPVYIRVTRTGDTWTEKWSTDGTNFTTAVCFTQALAVTSIGPFAGNAGSPPAASPAWTASVKYFHNTATSGVPPVVSAGGPVSDDFSTPLLNVPIWQEFPTGLQYNGTLTMTGTHAVLTVFGGFPHAASPGSTPLALLQSIAANADFEVEAKFDSVVLQAFQDQGILVRQDDNNFLRFDEYFDGSAARISAASVIGGLSTVRVDNVIPSGAPIYIRVKRTGDQWVESWSADATANVIAGTFTQPIAATQIGPFAGNDGPTPESTPGWTASVDYFFNTSSPIVPQDGPVPIITNVKAGSITHSGVTFTWTTNVPATTRVDVGVSPNYDGVSNGTQIDNTLVTSHSITYTGLNLNPACNQTLHYKVNSADARGHVGFTDDQVFTTAPCT